MEEGHEGTRSTPGASRMFRTLETCEPATATEQSAYDKWLDQTSTGRRRAGSVHGAEGVIPWPLWIALFFISP